MSLATLTLATQEPSTDAGPLHAGPLRVLALRGREAVSRPFSFKVTIAVSEADAGGAHASLLGQPAVLKLEVPNSDARAICGMVASVRTGHALDRERRALEVVLAPRLLRLAHRVTSRIFQDRTTPQIVATVLAEAAVPHRSVLVTKYQPRGYCVQHRESDLAFVTRLLAEEGIWFYFEHDDEDTVVLADSEDRHPSIAGDPNLVLRERSPDDAQLAQEGDLARFAFGCALAPNAVLHRSHDFRRPALDLRASAQAREESLRVYDHGESEEEGLGQAIGPASASTRLAQARRRSVAARGWTACRRLAPGYRFNLDDHALEVGGSYAISRVTHAGRASEQAGTEPAYEARFVCVPAQLGLRPPRPRRTLMQVTETARVVGPLGQEVYTDELGRVKVQFRWDLDGTFNENSSCWLRVATPWAGPAFGFQMTPRVGMEVLVTFLDGDVDRPVITGCLYNGTNRPPFPLPASLTKSGLVTRSSPRGTTGNELSFDDAAGREQVTLHAARDMAETVVRDRELRVDRDERVVVNGGAAERVRGDKVVEVGGTLRASAGGRSSRARGDVFDAVGGRRTEQIGRSHLLTVGGDQVVHVSGSSDLVVGTAGRRDHHGVTVFGDEVLTATGAVTVRAAERLVLACGDSTVELTPQGIRITGQRVDIAGAERTEVRGHGPVLTLDDNAELAGHQVRLRTKDATLALHHDARLEAPLIRLNSPDDLEQAVGGGALPETQPFRLKLSDAEYGVHAGKHYELLVDGLTLKGTTDPEGFVDTKIPQKATTVTLVVWLGDYPTGPTQKSTIKLGPLPAASTLPGAAVRLAHLGYYRGEPVDKLDAALSAALGDFQAHVGLPVTGQLDGPTVRTIDTMHGQ